MQHAFDSTLPIEKNTTIILFITNGAALSIQDPNVVGELYTTKNKYFDKHPLVKDVSLCLTGESILFAETNKDWKDSRKAMSPAFYKGKLENLVEIAKTAVKTTVGCFENIIATKHGEANIMQEVNRMTTRILLVCAFGIDISD